MSESSGNFVHPPRKERGRPTKVRRGDNSEMSGIETCNSYDSLIDESTEYQNAIDSLKRKTPGMNKTAKELKPPPITIFNMPIVQVKTELFSLGEIKLTRYGTKIFASTNEQFKLIKAHFTSHKYQYYTHTLREDQTNKFVIHGLHDIISLTWTPMRLQRNFC